MDLALPTKLGKEPIVEAVCEIRFSPAKVSISKVLPGMLYEALPGDKDITPTSAADVPEQVRRADPMFRYQPLVTVVWAGCQIQISDHSVAIACEIPYPGWGQFKQKILQVVGVLLDKKLLSRVDRYSLKYVDVIEALTGVERVSRINLSLTLGSQRLENQNYNIRMEVVEAGLIHVLNVAAPVNVQFHQAGKNDVEGTLLAIDTVYGCEGSTLDGLKSSLEERLDSMHRENKKQFFACLTEDTIEFLEPTYG